LERGPVRVILLLVREIWCSVAHRPRCGILQQTGGAVGIHDDLPALRVRSVARDPGGGEGGGVGPAVVEVRTLQEDRSSRVEGVEE
jgi:hypothetical protein